MRANGTLHECRKRAGGLLALALTLVLAASAAHGASESAAKSAETPSWKQEQLANGDAYTRFMALLNQPDTLSPATMRQADIAGDRIALYRVGDPRNRRFPAELYEAMESQMFDRLLAGGAFQVYECMECKTVRVTIKNDHLSMARRAASNARLRQIAESVGVDGMLLWDAYFQGDRAVLDTRMMDVETGRIVWSHQYTHSTEWQSNWAVYGGLWGIEATKFGYGPEPDVEVDRLVAVGAEFREATSLAEGLTYGLGITTFQNTARSDAVEAEGGALYVRLGLALDPLLGWPDKDYNNFELYLAPGDAFIDDTNNLLVRTGLEIRFTQTLFMNLGLVYLEERELDMGHAPPGRTGGEVGGTGYDISIGARF
ncbi:hypothetical protein [Thiohalorhabdus methylotrophus]|uniref:Uncharacterized protein n=1 Tax=Thiohalorhabdus methylotrophus TaxID=3242694 RepID=A0ABV4TX63_9GAMM